MWILLRWHYRLHLSHIRNCQLFYYNHFKIISHYCFHMNSSFVLSYYNMLEISREKKYTDGLRIFSFTRTTSCIIGDTRTIRRRLDHVDSVRMRSNLVLVDQIRPQKKSSPIYLDQKNVDTILMQWMSMKLEYNFQIREHSWPCLFHISELILFKQNYWTSSQVR